jgi:methylmalonyl-CoA mutase cobalamin-binding subunit
MVAADDEFRTRVRRLIDGWRREGLPSRDVLVNQAAELKKAHTDAGLRRRGPAMLTATVDDGIGQGIDLIGRFADALGFRVVFAGLMQPPARIAAEARRIDARLAGLTVLQLDSEPLLAETSRLLPAKTGLVVGGPAFRLDPDLADRVGALFSADDLAAFLDFLLHDESGMLQPP